MNQLVNSLSDDDNLGALRLPHWETIPNQEKASKYFPQDCALRYKNKFQSSDEKMFQTSY